MFRTVWCWRAVATRTAASGKPPHRVPFSPARRRGVLAELSFATCRDSCVLFIRQEVCFGLASGIGRARSQVLSEIGRLLFHPHQYSLSGSVPCGPPRGVAVSSGAKVAYQTYKGIFGSGRFRNLADKGARVQRLLWASTGTKNPQYSDLKYVESLIGPDTVNTAPVETVDAYRDHGEPKARLEEDVQEARWVLERLPELGVDIDHMTKQLEEEGVEKFDKPFDTLMDTLKKGSSTALQERADPWELGFCG
jgi:hypothetical protein